MTGCALCASLDSQEFVVMKLAHYGLHINDALRVYLGQRLDSVKGTK